MISNSSRFQVVIVVGCLIFSSFQCPKEAPLFLTKAAGIVKAVCADSESVSHVYLYDWGSVGQVVDSIALDGNNRFDASFAGAGIIELRGTDQCASDWGWIKSGYRNYYELEHKELMPLLEIGIDLPDSIDVLSMQLSVTRQLSSGTFFQNLFMDKNNFNTKYTETNAVSPFTLDVISHTYYRIQLIVAVSSGSSKYFDERVLIGNSPLSIQITEKKIL